MVFFTESEKETAELGFELGKKAKAGEIYCLDGHLGAGKTIFSKGFAKGMGIKDIITSPTFTIVNEYKSLLPLYHFDAYRLSNAKSAMCFEFEEYFEAGGVCLIEWAQNIKEVIPSSAYSVTIKKVDKYCDKRIIIIG